MFSSICSDFVSGLSDNSLQLLLNEAVGQLAVSSDSAVGGASVRLILIMANQQELRVHRLLLSFRGQWSHRGGRSQTGPKPYPTHS